MRTYTLQEYFYYTRLERNAGIVLCLLCAVAYSLPLFYPWLSPATGRLDFSEVQRVAASILPIQKTEAAKGNYVAFRGHENTSPRQLETFNFDPNTASKDDLMRLGLSSRTAQTILNYRAKGGHFYKKEDLKRMYTIRPEDYARLEAFVQIPPRPGSGKYEDFSKKAENQGVVTATSFEEKPFAPQNFSKKNTTAMVDINAATVEDWQQIRGIGPGWAKRIVNFREKLGGFTSAAQVSETFGLPDSVFQKMLPQLQAGSPVFKLIKLNAATLDELKIHPYLSSFQATILFNYRTQHGNFTDFASLKKVKAGFTDEDWRRLEPYFSYE
ncbi:MAG: helix-hairpin-helix domain-containing protein [Saprospiraceae bacterium]|nr:helix-hairpin-helix domain-containing protein [Saprospiraceae bacterium]MCF8252549.1 helix-hairpin-helix domain-containing protein [Saprospiraceae bacterium]MCF8282590.1 helix-hairpin-helix domain-containing protein [Bacteroidales bacterium]MCF8310796.1 helix-hairpin-helix domain-containing protein [Saprospiraceae bacterium]MCF8439374.1 helix-hairpin-helix domain-containing protein [Saprospiraceae bacterium]